MFAPILPKPIMPSSICLPLSAVVVWVTTRAGGSCRSPRCAWHRMFPAPRTCRRADGGRLGGVGVDHPRQFAHAGTGHHRLGDLADQLTGAARDDRRAEDAI